MQTGILVLLVVLVGIVCVALFFTNKEVRNIKAGIVKSRHDISALQTLLNDVGLTASGGRLGPDDSDNLIDSRSNHRSPPRSQFGPPGAQGLPPGMEMFPPGMFPPGFDPSQLPPIPEQNGGQSPRSDGSKGPGSFPEENINPEPLPANTESEPATLNLEKPEQSEQPGQPVEQKADVIPKEDVEEVKVEEVKVDTSQQKETAPKSTSKPATKSSSKATSKDVPIVISKASVNEEDSSSEEDSDSDEESSDED